MIPGRDITFQKLYLIISNGVEKALKETDPEKIKALLRQAQDQAEYVYRRSGHRNDMLLDERGRLVACFEFDPQTEQIETEGLTKRKVR